MTLDQSGNLGIGTISPAHKLQVNGITSFGQPGGVYGYSLDFPSPGPYPTLGFNNYFSGGSYVAGATGFGGVFQYQNGDGRLIYYNSNTTATGGSPLALNPRVTIDNDGNVGIGTTTPSSKLTIGTIAADGYSLKTFGNVRFGGHAVQTRDQSGLAKAMVYVLSDGTILRCYNGINISTAGNCGFTVTHFAVGGYGVNFGFPVSDRFVSVSVARQPLDVNYGIEFDLTGTVNNVNVRTYRSGQTSTTEDATFMVIVY